LIITGIEAPQDESSGQKFRQVKGVVMKDAIYG